MSVENEGKKKGKGFAGLSGMVSDIDEEIKTSAGDGREPPRSTPPGTTSEPPAPPPPANPPPAPPRSPNPSSGSGGSGSNSSYDPNAGSGPKITPKMWMGIAAIVVVILMSIGSGKKDSSKPSITYDAPNPSLQVQMPPVGSGNTFSDAQIRYCQVEKIKLDAIETILNQYSDYEVDRFNIKVTDFNSRCSSYRYRRGAVERVARELDSFAIANEAKLDWRGGGKATPEPLDRPISVPAPAPAKPKAKGACDNDGQCGSGLFCMKGKCGQQSRSGGPCSRSTECAGLTSQCVAGKCVGNDGNPPAQAAPKPSASGVKPPPMASECSGDGQCSSGNYCVLGKCRGQVETGGTCGRDTECAGLTSRCVSYTCVGDDGGLAKSMAPKKPTPPGGCESDGECGTGLYCVLGKCGEQVSPGSACSKHTDCSGATSLCQGGRCSGGGSSAPHPQTTSQPSAAPSYSSSSNRGGMPANAELDYTGKAWKCKRGFRKYGDQCEAVQMPPNAELDYTGENWKCRRGYRKYGERCDAVQMPANAELDYTGENWKCRRGYRKYGESCEGIQMPSNAELDYTGENWKCRRGYRKYGERCDAVQMPANAELDYTGENWKCRRGYRKYGESCEAVQVPRNGEIDYTGENWKCRTGFRQVGNECV